MYLNRLLPLTSHLTLIYYGLVDSQSKILGNPYASIPQNKIEDSYSFGFHHNVVKPLRRRKKGNALFARAFNPQQYLGRIG